MPNPNWENECRVTVIMPNSPAVTAKEVKVSADKGANLMRLTFSDDNGSTITIALESEVVKSICQLADFHGIKPTPYVP